MSKTIGRYQIQGELGRGGFGTVYRAWDPTVNRSVAIKLLTVQGDDDLLTRFRNEAAAAGNLHHRNIVTIHDFGEHNGVPYMVMQLLEGHTLQEVMSKRMPLNLIQKMNIMGQVAEGLHHAHMHGVVHRDVKPPNIMILPDESVQIMDFGIARLTASTSRQTRTGFVIGTVLYMAPEQFLQNKVVDHRADIWAYGVIYYEFLTGRHPFAAAEETSVLYQVAHVEPPPLRSVAPECPQALEDVITRLLQKDADFRYQNLKEVQFDVQPILVDLKREYAQELVAEVRQLSGDGRLEEAQAAAQRILELDPSNREAHSLLQQVKQRLQRRLIQPRITAMLQKAEQDVQAREFQAAIESLEGALRLSGTDPSIEARVVQVRALLEQSRRAERLVADAEREMRAQNFTAALRIASEAAHADPGNTSASHLLSRIQHELDQREAQRRLEEGINRARGLLLLQQYDEALVALDELATSFPDDATVSELLASARREKQQQERIERRRKDIAGVRDTLRRHNFEAAIGTLEMLLVEFPGDPEVKQLLGFAREEWDAHRRAQAISRTRSEADRLCNEQRFDEALAVIEQALNDYPGDPSLVRLVQAVSVARSDHEERERATAIRAILQKAGECERNNDPAGALRLLEQGLVEFPDAEALVATAGRLRQIVAQHERREAIARHVAGIESALSAREFPRAMALIDAARKECPGERTFDGLATRAAGLRNAAELEMARNRVRQEISDGHQELALELIAVALKRFPGDVQLSGMDREVRSAMAAAEQQARRDREIRDAAERHAAEERRAREAAERMARDERERKIREEAERQAREEAERRAAEHQARIEAERKAREEAERIAAEERKAREAAEERARLDAERKAREHTDLRIAEERKAWEAAERARIEAERKAREEAEARFAEERKARAEAERKARDEAERIAAAERARVEAERKAREEVEARLAEERKAREEAERKSREEAALIAAAERARVEAERKAREEAEARYAVERKASQAAAAAERRAREEAEARFTEERKAREAAERKAREEAERIAAAERARVEAERKAREEAERRAIEERQAREAAEKKAREEAARTAAAERKAREDAERRAAEAEKKAREDAARMAAAERARIEADRKAREEAERRALEERQAREAAERKAREQTERQFAEQRAQLEKERKAREEAERRAAEERARVEKERKAREEAERKASRKAAAVAVGGAAAAPAPARESERRSQLPLILGGAGIVVLALLGGIYLLGGRSGTPTTQTTQTAEPTPTTTAPVQQTQPSPVQTPTPTEVAEAPQRTVDPPKSEPAKAKPEPPKPEPAKQQPTQVARANTPPPPEPEPQQPAVQTPPPQPANRVGDTGGTRVVGDPGARTSVAVQRGPWMGKKNGKLAWTGQLPAGGRVVLNTQRVVDGPGELASIDLLPGFTEVEITGVKPNGRVVVTTNGPNALSISNTSGEPITFVEVTWRVKQ